MILSDFFKESGGKLSMTRLLCFLSFFPASYCVIHSGSDLIAYLTTYMGGYLGGKHGGAIANAIGGNKQDADDTVEPTK